MGFPTINLAIPKGFSVENGVYAVKVRLGAELYNGALHYGPIPVFGENKKV